MFNMTETPARATVQAQVNLFKAMLAAQTKMGKLVKDKTNPHLKNTYASLAAVMATIQGPLSEAGIVIYQDATLVMEERNSFVQVVSRLIHAESGEYVEASLPIPLTKVDAQSIGSAITYGRRYLAITQCGLAPDDDADDDGESAVGRDHDGAAPARQRAQNGNGAAPERAPQGLIDELLTLAKSTYGEGWPGKLKEIVGAVSQGAVTDAAKLSPAQIRKLIDGIKKRQAAAQAEQEPARDAATQHALDVLTGSGAIPEEEEGRPNWTSPADAQAWAVETGLATNGAIARKAWVEMVKTSFSGALEAEDLQDAFDLYYETMTADL